MGKVESRWCEPNYIKQWLVPLDEKEKKGGLSLYDDHNVSYTYDKSITTMIFANDQSNKEENIIAPLLNSLINAGESFVINDKNYKMYNEFLSILKEKKYDVKVVDFDNPLIGNGFNPITLPYKIYKMGRKDDTISILENIVYSIFHENDSTDPFWYISAGNYFIGLVLYLFDNAEEDKINLNSVNNLSAEFSKMKVEEIKNILNTIKDSGLSYTYLADILLMPNETKAGIISTFDMKMKTIISRENLSLNMANDNFDIEKIANNKVAIFIRSDLNKIKYLVPMLVTELFYANYVFENYSKRFNYILDDFNNIGTFCNDFQLMLSNSENYNSRFFIILDSLSGLISKYGEELGNIIFMGVDVKIYLLSNDISTTEAISKMCGANLISSDELRMMEKDVGIVLIPRLYPFKNKFICYSFSGKREEIPIYQRKSIKVFKNL